MQAAISVTAQKRELPASLPSGAGGDRHSWSLCSSEEDRLHGTKPSVQRVSHLYVGMGMDETYQAVDSEVH